MNKHVIDLNHNFITDDAKGQAERVGNDFFTKHVHHDGDCPPDKIITSIIKKNDDTRIIRASRNAVYDKKYRGREIY
jgi:hypothetical protein